MKITRQEADNVINMFLSPDADNGHLAYKAVEAFNFKDADFGWLRYIFKYSRLTYSEWKSNAPEVAKELSKYYDFDSPFTYAKGLSVLISMKADKESVTAFLERHVAELVQMLDNMGYPTKNLDFNLTLKK
jgi:hypothetical protein